MATVRRVGPCSAFKIGLILYGILGLLLGIVMACISMVAGSFGGLGHSAVPAAGGTATAVSWDLRSFAFGTGFGAIIFFPLLYVCSAEFSRRSARSSIIWSLAGSVGLRLTSARIFFHC